MNVIKSPIIGPFSVAIIMLNYRRGREIYLFFGWIEQIFTRGYVSISHGDPDRLTPRSKLALELPTSPKNPWIFAAHSGWFDTSVFQNLWSMSLS